MLYTLVTDRVFLREPSVVWESLVDVDGQSSSFFDSQFRRSSPAGGDFAGQTGEQIARMYDRREEDEAMNLE
jgi:ubiquitin carboxyl-terminal hydrolase MINDY-1/2